MVNNKNSALVKKNNSAIVKVEPDYIAPEIHNYVFLGKALQAFLTKSGKVVYSDIGVERCFGLKTGGLATIRRTLAYQETFPNRTKTKKGRPSNQDSVSVLGEVGEEKADPQESDVCYLVVKTGRAVTRIRVIDSTELEWFINYLAKRGNVIAISMQRASLAALIRENEDRYLGIHHPAALYAAAATAYRPVLEEQERVELRSISGAFTNPTFACNLYTVNNNLLFGEGQTRDTYKGDDRPYRLMMEGALEMFQCGLKAAGLSMDTIIEKSHAYIAQQLNDKKEAKKVSAVRKALKG